jgi:hypothetical protein
MGMRKLTTEHRAQLLISLVEGNSIASTCRMFGVNKITVLRLLADAGTYAAELHDEMVKGLGAERIQLDEVWSFVHCKNANVRPLNASAGHGDAWTWVSIDADTKLVINWLVGKRTAECANEFVGDLAGRLTNRVQITSDGLAAVRQASRTPSARKSISRNSSRNMRRSRTAAMPATALAKSSLSARSKSVARRCHATSRHRSLSARI